MRKLVLSALLCGGLAATSGCPVDEAGQFHVSWSIKQGSANGPDISCAQAGAGGVSMLETDSFGQGYDDIFTCEDGEGTSSPRPLDDYVIVLSLLEQGTDNNLGSSMPHNVSILADGDLVEVGTIVFVTPGGPSNITFVVDYGAASGSNCAGGAGGKTVGTQNMSLTAQGSQTCIPTTLTTSDGGSFDICSDEPPCIESDVVQTLEAVDEGDYDLLVEGLYDDAGTSVACYSGTVPVTVDGSGDDVDLGTVGIDFDGTDPFCDTI